MAIKTGRNDRQRAPEREVERHDAMARLAWTEGYLYGIGKTTVARALARRRTFETIAYRRASHEVVRALDRLRKRILENIR